LHLAATLPNLLDCGHCFISTLRLKDDVTDFGSLVHEGVVTVRQQQVGTMARRHAAAGTNTPW